MANVNVNGLTAAVTASAPVGKAQGLYLVSAECGIGFLAYSPVNASATIEFEAGQPVQMSLTTLASAPWISMYPG